MPDPRTRSPGPSHAPACHGPRRHHVRRPLAALAARRAPRPSGNTGQKPARKQSSPTQNLPVSGAGAGAAPPRGHAAAYREGPGGAKEAALAPRRWPWPAKRGMEARPAGRPCHRHFFAAAPASRSRLVCRPDLDREVCQRFLLLPRSARTHPPSPWSLRRALIASCHAPPPPPLDPPRRRAACAGRRRACTSDSGFGGIGRASAARGRGRQRAG